MKTPRRLLLAIAILLPPAACDDGTGGATATQDAGAREAGAKDAGATTQDAGSPAKGTTGVLCDHKGEGKQRLVYTRFDPRNNTKTPIDETLTYRYAWTCSATERTLTGNGVPNHAVTKGEFASRLTAQTISSKVTLEPAVTGKVTTVKQPGYALNSIKFDPGTAGTCPNTAKTDTNCNYAMGRDKWRMVATPGSTSPWKFNFGVDENDAHVQPTGQYHYHGNPVKLVASLNAKFATSMTLVGWANDGFPIYSLYGHTDPKDSTSTVAKMKSSYRTIATAPSDRPSTTDFPLGHFESDWQYVANSGDLDECNGRFGVTPDFPKGIYHYYITETYPFVQRCVKGTSSGGGRGGPPPPRP